MVVGSFTIGSAKRVMAPKMWHMPYSFSALMNLSAIIPNNAGIKSDAIPIVENSAPNLEPVHSLELVTGSINGYILGRV